MGSVFVWQETRPFGVWVRCSVSDRVRRGFSEGLSQAQACSLHQVCCCLNPSIPCSRTWQLLLALPSCRCEGLFVLNLETTLLGKTKQHAHLPGHCMLFLVSSCPLARGILGWSEFRGWFGEFGNGLWAGSVGWQLLLVFIILEQLGVRGHRCRCRFLGSGLTLLSLRADAPRSIYLNLTNPAPNTP